MDFSFLHFYIQKKFTPKFWVFLFHFPLEALEELYSGIALACKNYKVDLEYDLKEMEIALKKSGAIKENLVKTMSSTTNL